jgi:hypothetical protein
LRSILCVGAGISGEPHALAAAGFDAMVPSEFLEGRTVAGDLRDVTICPGPYDVIIERKTLQLFAEHRQSVPSVG